MKNKKIIVTGGSGYLGRNIISELLNKKFEVINLDLNKQTKNHPNLKFYEVDISKSIDLKFENIDYLIHLAGFADLNQSITNAEKTIRLNILGTLNVLNLCKSNNISRIIYSSSMYALGDKGSFYGVSKKASEDYIRVFCRQNNLQYTILRVGSLYGGDSTITNGIHRYLIQAIENKVINYNGTEEDLREYIHVKDASNIFLEIFNKDYINKHINIVGTQQYKVTDAFKIIFEILDIKYNVKINNNSNSHYNFSPYSPQTLASKYYSNINVDFASGIKDLIDRYNFDSQA